LPLAGLILTDEESAVAGGQPRALLPIAGQTLIEYQVRVARSCGVGHIVVLVDQLPAGLVEAFDRLRDDGIEVDIARDARDAADRIHPEEQVLVMAGGAVAGRAAIEKLTAQGDPLLLSVPEAAENQHFERIDGLDRWSGVAIIDGRLVRDTAAILGDWTLGPTLLRTALQAGTSRERSKDVALVRDASDAAAASLALLSAGSRTGRTAFSRLFVGPIVTHAMPWIMARHVPFDIMAILPIILVCCAILLAAIGWAGLAFAIFLLSAVPAVVASRMADIAARTSDALGWHWRLHLPGLCVLLCGAGWLSMKGGAGWGALALSAWGSVALLLQPPGIPRPNWMADSDWAALTMFGAIVFGQPLAGLVAIVIHTVITQFLLVRRLS
jgi:hypothetical protein